METIQKEDLVLLFREITKDDKYEYETFIWESGFNSLQAVYVISKIYSLYHIKLELKELLTCCRIKEVYALMKIKL